MIADDYGNGNVHTYGPAPVGVVVVSADRKTAMESARMKSWSR